jgi:hypothetical protein
MGQSVPQSGPTIVSASYRTDIPAFYAAWFRARLHAGFARVVNPYGGPPSRVSLAAPDCLGFVFWTRNAAPFVPVLDDVRLAGLPFFVQFTVLGYPRPLDAATIRPEDAIAQIREIVTRYGPGHVVWRYDPIVFSTLTEPDRHRAMFARLADGLSGAVDEVIVSVAQIYRKTARNLNSSARRYDFTWRDPARDEKGQLLRDLAALAADRGIRLSLCGQPELLQPGIGEARCIDADRLSRLAGQPLQALAKAHRQTCACHASRDIGSYDSCPHGCAYCYAVSGRDVAKRRFSAHDPTGEYLLPPNPRSTMPL